ncbi:MAG: hypothetical protein ACM3O3_10000 [Syntrophothermus sp.]
MPLMVKQLKQEFYEGTSRQQMSGKQEIIILLEVFPYLYTGLKDDLFQSKKIAKR